MATDSQIADLYALVGVQPDFTKERAEVNELLLKVGAKPLDSLPSDLAAALPNDGAPMDVDADEQATPPRPSAKAITDNYYDHWDEDNASVPPQLAVARKLHLGRKMTHRAFGPGGSGKEGVLRPGEDHELADDPEFQREQELLRIEDEAREAEAAQQKALRAAAKAARKLCACVVPDGQTAKLKRNCGTCSPCGCVVADGKTAKVKSDCVTCSPCGCVVADGKTAKLKSDCATCSPCGCVVADGQTAKLKSGCGTCNAHQRCGCMVAAGKPAKLKRNCASCSPCPCLALTGEPRLKQHCRNCGYCVHGLQRKSQCKAWEGPCLTPREVCARRIVLTGGNGDKTCGTVVAAKNGVLTVQPDAAAKQIQVPVLAAWRLEEMAEHPTAMQVADT